MLDYFRRANFISKPPSHLHSLYVGILFNSVALGIHLCKTSQLYNRPRSKNPYFQNEARCTTFLVKMSFICMKTKNDIHIKGGAPTLVLKQRPGGTRKWPISKRKSLVVKFARFTFCAFKVHGSFYFTLCTEKVD